MEKTVTLTKKYFDRAVIKSRWPGISPSYYDCAPLLLSLENK